MFVIPDRDGEDVVFIETRKGVWEGEATDGSTWEIHAPTLADAAAHARIALDDSLWNLDNEDGVSYNELEAGWPWDEDEVERGFNEAHARSEEEGYEIGS